MVKNLPSNAGDAGSIPGRGAKIPHATGATEPARLNERASVLQTTEPMRPGAHMPQLEGENPLQATTREKPAHHNKRSRVPQLSPDTAK